MNALENLRERLGSEVYLEVTGWRLYLRDVRTPPLADHLAKTLAPLLTPTGIPDLREVLTGIPITLGGGKSQVSLWECLPAASVRNLERVLEQYAREWLD